MIIFQIKNLDYFEQLKRFAMAMSTVNIPASSKTSSTGIVETNYGALSTLIVVFFFWGFIAAGNSVFIPFCKHYFH